MSKKDNDNENGNGRRGAGSAGAYDRNKLAFEKMRRTWDVG
jgi:hypothetical protein